MNLVSLIYYERIQQEMDLIDHEEVFISWAPRG